MTHRRQVWAVLAGCVIAATWASGSSASTASHPARQGIVIDSTNYQSVQQLLANTQVLVVAKVDSVRVDRAAPVSQPGSLVTLTARTIVRGHPGKHFVVEQTRGTASEVGSVKETPLQRGRTYLLCLARAAGTPFLFVVGGTTGTFSYDPTTQRFTKRDVSAQWEPSDFALSLVKVGAETYPDTGSTNQRGLTQQGGSGAAAVTWSPMENDLGLNLTDVACPSEGLCLFAGDISPPTPGEQIPAVAVSTGPFSPHSSVVGTNTTFPPSPATLWSSVACASPTLCVLSSVDGVYVTTNPVAAHWDLEVAPSSQYFFGQVSCPSVSFCAVTTGSGVLVTNAPSGGPSAWSYVRLGSVGLGVISCPSSGLCVAGGSGDAEVGGWIETSSDPLNPASWHGAATVHPQFAQHSGQYSVSGISCPTTDFCVAAIVAGASLVSTDPAGGIGTWRATGTESNALGFASCTSTGSCAVSGVGTFETRGGAVGPGTVGYPLPGISCVSTSFCVSVTDGQLATGKGSG